LQGSGKTVKQQAELAAHVAQRAAFRAELTPLQQVQCVVDAAQAWVNPGGLESWFWRVFFQWEQERIITWRRVPAFLLYFFRFMMIYDLGRYAVVGCSSSTQKGKRPAASSLDGMNHRYIDPVLQNIPAVDRNTLVKI